MPFVSIFSQNSLYLIFLFHFLVYIILYSLFTQIIGLQTKPRHEVRRRHFSRYFSFPFSLISFKYLNSPAKLGHTISHGFNYFFMHSSIDRQLYIMDRIFYFQKIHGKSTILIIRQIDRQIERQKEIERERERASEKRKEI